MKDVLREHIEEMAYPTAFNMDTFKSINSFRGRIQYCVDKLEGSLGRGSSRRVFKIDNEKVLKLAMNKKGIAQNEAECDWFLQKIGLFAKVYDYDENYRWVEMQLARKAKPSDFKTFFGYDFNVICAYIEYVHSLYSRRNPWFSRDTRYDDLFAEIEESEEYQNGDSVFYMLYEYMANTQLQAYGDLKRISSWGIVSENGQESLVIIDYGLNDDVAQEFYHYRINEDDIVEMVKKAVSKILQEAYENPYDSPLYHAYENIWASEILYEFLDDKRNGIAKKQWNLIPAEQYQNLLNRYMQWGDNARIPERIVDNWIELICNNLITLEYMTELAGHSSSFPFDDVTDVFGDEVENCKDYYDYAQFLEDVGFYDWCQLPDGSDAISDYGIEPISKILNELSPNSTPEDKLIIINRCLDVVHCRGDLASAFIEGGRRTCSAISGIKR